MFAIPSTAIGAAIREKHRRGAALLLAVAFAIFAAAVCGTVAVADAEGGVAIGDGRRPSLARVLEASGGDPAKAPERSLSTWWPAARPTSDDPGKDVSCRGSISTSVTGQCGFPVTVSLSGRRLSRGEFTILLVEDGATIAVGSSEADGRVTMDPVSYTEPGTHRYEIREVAGDEPGIAYSTASWAVTTEITMSADGSLAARHRVDGPRPIAFENAYRALPAFVVLSDVYKIRVELDSAQQVGHTFSVALEHDGANLATGTSDGDGDVALGPACFEKPGVYECTLLEEAGSDPGVTYDTTRHRITVTVIDLLDGRLRASVEPQGDAVGLLFTNRYAPRPLRASVTDWLSIRMRLDGRPLGVGELGCELVEDGEVVCAGTNDVAGRVSMPAMSYARAGRHVYALRAAAGDLGGVRRDAAVYRITTTVSDDGEANLSAAYALDGDEGGHEVSFTSSYAPAATASSVTDQIPVGVRLQNSSLSSGAFSFELVEGDSVVSTGESDDVGNVTIAPVLYNAPGQHTYIVRQIAGADPHITYDSASSWRIRTAVADAGDGTFSIKHRQIGSRKPITFSNTYLFEVSSSVSDDISVRCELRGRAMTDSEFGFELLEDDRVVSTGSSAADGIVRMAPITYFAPGTRRYALRQLPVSASGVTSDTASYQIITTITKDSGGRLCARHRLGGRGDSVTFTSSYATAPLDSRLTDAIPVSVSLVGRDIAPLAAGEFGFELLEDDRVVASGSNDELGRVSLDPVRYTAPGTHLCTLCQVRVSTGGITYDERTYQISTTVTDNGDGTLRAEHTLEGGGETAAFENAYSAAPVSSSLTDDICVLSRLFGRAADAGEFGFELLEGDRVVASGRNGDDGRVIMGPVTYEEPGKRACTLREVPGELGGVTYDGSAFPVNVTIVDSGQGFLRVSYTLRSGASQVTFDNAYSVAPLSSSLTDQISVRVELAGRKLVNREFAFELRESGVVVASGVSDAAGAVRMGTARYIRAGAHRCTLVQLSRSAGGISYDEADYEVGITLSDNGDGTLRADYARFGRSASNDIVFKNSYAVAPVRSSVTAQIPVEQRLAGRDQLAGEFAVELVEGDRVVARGAADVDGVVSMDPITYTGAGEHGYALREVAGSRRGVSYDREVHEIVTTVIDNGDGTLGVRHVAKDGAEHIAFKNTYTLAPVQTSPSDHLDIAAALEGRPLVAGELAFELDRGDEVIATGTNDATGRVSLPPLSFESAGTYRYRLREVAGSAGGIVYDTTVHLVEVEVTDIGGALSTAFSADGGDRVVFTNVYTAGPTPARLSDQVEIVLELAGREQRAREFVFELVEGEEVVARGANRPDGVVTFDPVSYETAGEHVYTLREAPGSEDGMAYDEKAYRLTASAADAGDGTYQVVFSMDDGARRVVFSNAFVSGSVAGGVGQGEDARGGEHRTGPTGVIPSTGDIAFMTVSVATVLTCAAIVSRALARRLRRRRGPFPPLRRF